MRRSRSPSATVSHFVALAALAGAMMMVLGGCDESAAHQPDAGPPDLQKPSTPPGPRCGDGHIDPGESCDDGPGNGTRGCSELCQPHPPRTPATKPIDCGDGFIDPSEVCDDGSQNGWVESACAPDCGGRVQERLIVPSQPIRSGDLGESPVDTIDRVCPPGFAALFSDGVQRRPPRTPDDASTSWVLDRYTAYRRPDGELVWTTASDPRLGMRRDRQVELWSSPIECDNEPCPRALTGIDANWEPTDADDCHAWSSDLEGMTHLGNPGSLRDYLWSEPQLPCDFGGAEVVAICVEQ